jgi:hypothetical protein
MMSRSRMQSIHQAINQPKAGSHRRQRHHHRGYRQHLVQRANPRRRRHIRPRTRGGGGCGRRPGGRGGRRAGSWRGGGRGRARWRRGGGGRGRGYATGRPSGSQRRQLDRRRRSRLRRQIDTDGFLLRLDLGGFSRLGRQCAPRHTWSILWHNFLFSANKLKLPPSGVKPQFPKNTRSTPPGEPGGASGALTGRRIYLQSSRAPIPSPGTLRLSVAAIIAARAA